jgi:GTP-binding protein HflX
VHNGEGLDELVNRIAGFVSDGTERMDLVLPLDRTDLLARLHREGTVHEVNYENEGVRVNATVPTKSAHVLKPFAMA